METNRRDFLTLLGAGAAVSAGFVSRAHAEENTGFPEVEAANVQVVNDFCAAWASLDLDNIYQYVADDITFQMTESSPTISGKQALIEGTRQFLAPAKSARFEVLRTAAMGNIVINDRIDYFEMGETHNAFHVTGFFFLKDGKIVEWRDYTVPKAETAH